MSIQEFDYELPDRLIARYPLPERSAARLLVLRGDELEHRRVRDLPLLLRPGDLLVFNNTRVIPARLHGRKDSGGQVEMLIERIDAPTQARVHLRASKPPRAGSDIVLADATRLRVSGRQESLFIVDFPEPVRDILERLGEVPLPPYLDRPDESTDRERYQTVYARHDGSVAAPTAGLHFDAALLQALRDRGVATAEVTLHVGAGTFQPVRVENLDQHVMHSEWLELGEDVVAAVAATRARGGRVVAVGTTATRALETAAASGSLRPYVGETQLFIHPPYRFQVVDALFTNFHLPRSTLLMLVAALAGRERVLAAYRAAVAQDYRFFSYGDAMWLERE